MDSRQAFSGVGAAGQATVLLIDDDPHAIDLLTLYLGELGVRIVGARSGIGYMIWTSWQVFQVEKMYVGLVVIAIVGFATAILLTWVERVLVPWKHA